MANKEEMNGMPAFGERAGAIMPYIQTNSVAGTRGKMPRGMSDALAQIEQAADNDTYSGDVNDLYLYSKKALPEPMYGIYTNTVSSNPSFYSDLQENETLIKALRRADQVRNAQKGVEGIEEKESIARRFADEDMKNNTYPQTIKDGFSYPRYEESTYWGFPEQLDRREAKLKTARRLAHRKMVYEALKDKGLADDELTDILSKFD